MVLFPLHRILWPVLLIAGSAIAGTVLYHRIQMAEAEQRHREYERQLRGQLTQKEQELQALNTELGLARSRLMRQEELERDYQTRLTEKDAAFEQFREKHHLRVKSLSDSIHSIEQRFLPGSTKVVPLSPASTEAVASSSRQALRYEYDDESGRAHFEDPDIWVQGNEVLTLKQLFRLRGTIFQQADGSLMTERIQLVEVAKAEDGTYRELAKAELVDARFSYASEPSRVTPGPRGWRPSFMATVGTSFRSEGPLRLGLSVRVAPLERFGLAAGVSSDFMSLEGTGADVFVTYEPPLGGLNPGLVVGGGIHLPLSGPRRVLPCLTLGFVAF
jgi:hypothetical protein